VLDEGDAGKITEWTLAQRDDDRISDGVYALTAVAGRADPAEARRAVDGVARVYAKLAAGWPGYTGASRYRQEVGPLPADQRLKNLLWQIRCLYEAIAVSHQSDGLVDLFYRIEPDPAARPDLYRLWAEIDNERARYTEWLRHNGADQAAPGEGQRLATTPPTRAAE
jgi:hypothetical protein